MRNTDLLVALTVALMFTGISFGLAAAALAAAGYLLTSAVLTTVGAASVVTSVVIRWSGGTR
jgi:hypothetical protein